MTAPPSPTSPADTKRKADLNAAHVAAAALAAVTTAVVGSLLGAAGTLIGAAGASVITTVGTAVYQTSLERSRKRVHLLAQRARPSPAAPQGSKAEPSHRSRRFVTLRWGAAIVAALGAFLLAMTVITGFEWANGQTVGGNGKGTTIGQVINDQPAARTPATTPGPGAPAATETPTPTPTQTTQAPAGILPGIIDAPTTTPDSDGPTPTRSADRPAPSEVTSPPLIPPGLTGGGG